MQFSDRPTSVTITLFDIEKNTYGITWNTREEPLSPVIQVCEGEHFDPANARTFEATYKQYSTYSLDEALYNYYVSKGVIELPVGKTYTYRAYDQARDVSSDIGKITPKSSDTDTFSFIHVSDTQTTKNHAVDPIDTGLVFRSVLAAVDKHFDPNFMLHTGDVVEWSRYESFWQAMIDCNGQYWTSFPCMPISGNHETTYQCGSYETEKHFHVNIPEQIDTALGFYYAFEYGNVKFIMLNTNRLESYQLTQDQYDFLVSELQNNNKLWTIVGIHNPLYSSGKYGAAPWVNQVAVALKEQLVELFARYGVDLVLQGHDHQFVKTHPMVGVNTPDKTHKTVEFDGVQYAVNPKGAIYVMHGVGGNHQRRDDPIDAELEKCFEWYDVSYPCSFANISISGNRLTVDLMSAWEALGLKKVKSYGIIKEAAEGV